MCGRRDTPQPCGLHCPLASGQCLLLRATYNRAEDSCPSCVSSRHDHSPTQKFFNGAKQDGVVKRGGVVVGVLDGVHIPVRPCRPGKAVLAAIDPHVSKSLPSHPHCQEHSKPLSVKILHEGTNRGQLKRCAWLFFGVGDNSGRPCQSYRGLLICKQHCTDANESPHTRAED